MTILKANMPSAVIRIDVSSRLLTWRPSLYKSATTTNQIQHYYKSRLLIPKTNFKLAVKTQEKSRSKR